LILPGRRELVLTQHELERIEDSLLEVAIEVQVAGGVDAQAQLAEVGDSTSQRVG
jgi:hypothetical protein